MDTEEALSQALKEEILSFEVDSLADMTAMLKMHEEWVVYIDGDAPAMFVAFGETKADIPNCLDVPLDKMANIGNEVQVLNLYRKALYEEFGEQALDESTKNAVYQLSIAGKHINNSDLVRLAALWLWDTASEATPDDLDAGFKDAYEQLTKRIDDAGMGGVKPLSQFMTRRKRIKGYFDATNKCIKNMYVFNLND